MKFCTQCGAQLAEDAAFCTNCGATAQPTEQPAQPTAQPHTEQPQQPVSRPYTAPVAEQPAQPTAQPYTEQPQQPVSQPYAPAPTGYQYGGQATQPYTEPAQPYAEQPQQPIICHVCGYTTLPGQPCPNCGSVSNPDSPAPKKKSKGLKLGIIAAASVAVLAAAGVAVALLLSSPKDAFLRIQQEWFTERLGITGEAPAETGISTDLTLTAEVEGNDEMNELLRGTELVIKAKADDTTALVGGELTIMDEELLRIEASYADGTLKAALPDVDDRVFVADLNEVLSSITGSEVDLSAEIGSMTEAEYNELISAYGGIIYSLFTNDNVTKETVDDIDFDDLVSYDMGSYEKEILGDFDDGFKGTVYTFQPTEEDIEEMLLALAERMENDELLTKAVLELSGVGALSAIFGDEYIDDMYGTSVNDLRDELESGIKDAAEELSDNAGDYAESFADMGFVWTLCVEGDEVRMIRIEFEEESTAVVYAYELNDKGKEYEMFYVVSQDEIPFRIAGESVVEDGETDGTLGVYLDYYDYWSGDYADISAIADYKIDEKGIVDGSLDLDYDYYIGYDYDYNYMTIDFEFDPNKVSPLGLVCGEFEYTTPYEEYTFELTVSENGDHTVRISTNDAWNFDYMFEAISVTLNASKSSTAKEPTGRTEDITNYTEMEMEELATELAEKLEESLVGQLERIAERFYEAAGYGGYYGYGYDYDYDYDDFF